MKNNNIEIKYDIYENINNYYHDLYDMIDDMRDDFKTDHEYFNTLNLIARMHNHTLKIMFEMPYDMQDIIDIILYSDK